MDAVVPLKYIAKIVLEIVDRRRLCCRRWRAQRMKKFNLAKFNAREAAYAFLRQYDGESFVKAQKIKIWYNNQELRLYVRDLIYGNVNANSYRTASSMVEFIYRRMIFGEIKWPATTAYRTNRVRWAHDYEKSSTRVDTPEIQINDSYFPSSFDEIPNANLRMVPCTNRKDDDDQLLSVNSMEEKSSSPLWRSSLFRRSISAPERSINAAEATHVFGRVSDEENLFRSSVYVHLH